jgi:hypothetical protein
MAYAYWVLHSFGETATDGQVPVAALIQASDGNLYGTTENGGVYSDPNASEEFQGTIYSLTTTLAMQAHVSAHSTVGKMVSYTVTITLYNTGYFEAANVTVDRATLGSKASSTAMPLPVGNIGAGAYKSVTCTFLAKAGILQTLVGFDVTVTFTGGTFIGNCIVTL